MTSRKDIIVIDVVQHNTGLYEATSRDLRGVCVVHRSFDKIVGDLPNVIRLWYKLEKGADVEVLLGQAHQTDGSFAFPVIPLPVEIAAAALAR